MIDQQSSITYRIDGDDKIVSFNKAWVDFASENDAPELAAVSIVGRSLWDFIGDETTREIYRHLLRRARGGAEPLISFRCDSPRFRRWVRMSIRCCGAGGIEFRSEIIEMTQRLREVALLTRRGARNGNNLVLCAWCSRMRLSDRIWLDLEQACDELEIFREPVLPMISHGMCPDCFHLLKGDEESDSDEPPCALPEYGSAAGTF